MSARPARSPDSSSPCPCCCSVCTCHGWCRCRKTSSACRWASRCCSSGRRGSPGAPPPDGYTLNLHPVGLAAWLGLLLTALNLFPIGQLDGGHIAYAVLGRRSTAVSVGATGIVVALVFLSASWFVWALLMIAMLVFLGPRHPRTPDEDVPLDPARQLLALATAAIFAICFTPAPFSPLDLVAGP